MPTTPSLAHPSRMGDVPTDQAARLLSLAEKALAYLDSVARAGTRPGATGPERAAASRTRSCLDTLAPLAAPLDTVMAELRAAGAERRPAKISAEQAAAIEAYASCAGAFQTPSVPEQPRGGWLEVAVGIGLPALGAGLVAL
jgi:hypothetical protein